MTLRKNKTTKPEETTDAPDTEVKDEATKETTTPPVEDKAPPVEDKAPPVEDKAPPVEDKAPPVGEKAVATTKKAAPPVAVGDIVEAPSLMSLRDAMPPEEFGNIFKRLVGSNGAVMEAGDKFILGTYVDIQVLSTSDRWFITPDADPNKDPDAAAFCRASYDGKTILDTEGGSITIEEYTESVEDYDFNPPKKYLDIYAMIIHTQDQKMEEEAVSWGIVQISISPTSVKGYRAFEMQGKLAVARGVVKPHQQNCIRMVAKIKSNKNNTWTALDPAHIPHSDLGDYIPLDMTE